MNQHIRDSIARLRAEAKRFREAARFQRTHALALAARPIGQRDPMALLNHRSRASEYRMEAHKRAFLIERLLLEHKRPQEAS